MYILRVKSSGSSEGSILLINFCVFMVVCLVVKLSGVVIFIMLVVIVLMIMRLIIDVI